MAPLTRSREDASRLAVCLRLFGSAWRCRQETSTQKERSVAVVCGGRHGRRWRLIFPECSRPKVSLQKIDGGAVLHLLDSKFYRIRSNVLWVDGTKKARVASFFVIKVILIIDRGNTRVVVSEKWNRCLLHLAVDYKSRSKLSFFSSNTFAMVKRVPTPPPADDEPRVLVVKYPYPPYPNLDRHKELLWLIYWLGCVMGKEHISSLYSICHKVSPSTSSDALTSSTLVADRGRNGPH